MKVNISKQKQPDPGRFSDCFICGAPLLYSGQSEMRTCAVCGKTGLSNAVCAEGH